MSGCRKISELLNSYFVSVFSEEEGGDLLKSSFSFPGTPEEELGTDPSLRHPGPLVHPGWAQPRAGAQGAALGYGLAPPQSPPLPVTVAKKLSVKPFWAFLTCWMRLENAKENHQIWVTLRQLRIQKKVFKEIANLPSFVFFSLSYSLENILSVDGVFNVTFSIWKNNRSKRKSETVQVHEWYLDTFVLQS